MCYSANLVPIGNCAEVCQSLWTDGRREKCTSFYWPIDEFYLLLPWALSILIFSYQELMETIPGIALGILLDLSLSPDI